MIERLDGTYLWGALIHYIELPHLLLFRITFVLLVSLVVIAAGAGLAGRQRRSSRGRLRGQDQILALNLLLILGLVLSPTKVLETGSDFFDCAGTDVFASYRKASGIEPGHRTRFKIYWEGRLLAIFLYMPNVNIYPPQMNHVHSYFIGGDAETLLRYSQWNDELARQWLAEADYILVQNTEKVYLRG